MNVILRYGSLYKEYDSGLCVIFYIRRNINGGRGCIIVTDILCLCIVVFSPHYEASVQSVVPACILFFFKIISDPQSIL